MRLKKSGKVAHHHTANRSGQDSHPSLSTQAILVTHPCSEILSCMEFFHTKSLAQANSFFWGSTKEIAIFSIPRGKASSVRLLETGQYTQTVHTVLYKRLEEFFRSNFDYM